MRASASIPSIFGGGWNEDRREEKGANLPLYQQPGPSFLPSHYRRISVAMQRATECASHIDGDVVVSRRCLVASEVRRWHKGDGTSTKGTKGRSEGSNGEYRRGFSMESREESCRTKPTTLSRIVRGDHTDILRVSLHSGLYFANGKVPRAPITSRRRRPD